MKLVWTLLTFTLLFQVSEELRLRKFKRPRGFLFKTKKIKLGRIRNPLRNIGSILKGTNNKPKVSNLRNNLEKLISGGIINEERRNPNQNLKERAILQDSEPLIPTNVIDVDLQQQQKLEIHPEQQISQHEREVIQEQQRKQQEKEQRQKLRQQKIQDRLQRQKERQLRQQLRQQRFEERQERRRLRQQRQRERQQRRRNGQRNNNIVDPHDETFVEAGGVNRDSAGSFRDPLTSIQDQHASGIATHNIRQQPVQHQDS